MHYLGVWQHFPFSDFIPLNSKFVPLNYETIVDIRDAKWFIYIRMPLYPSIFIEEKDGYYKVGILHARRGCTMHLSGFTIHKRGRLLCINVGIVHRGLGGYSTFFFS